MSRSFAKFEAATLSLALCKNNKITLYMASAWMK